MSIATGPLGVEIIEIARSLAPAFARRAPEHDRNNTFPFENYDDMKRAGYHAVTLPAAYGGRGARLFELCLGQEELAVGDGATALGIGMHLSLLGRLAEERSWPPPLWERVACDVVERGALINSAATEPEMGSPSHGGMPVTTARRVPGGWEITGRKTFTTIAPVLDYILVLARIEDGSQRGNFLIERGTPGLRIEETWEALGMRATGSHDLVLERARVAGDALIPSATRPVSPSGGRAWAALSLGAVYLGVARAARDFAVGFAKERVPTGLGKPISELPGVQQNLGRMNLTIRAARAVLLDTARAWDEDSGGRAGLAPDIAASKHLATNCAIEVTDLAMRLAGGAALSRRLPIERLFRDARAGLYNPPSDEAALGLIGRWALGERPQLS